MRPYCCPLARSGAGGNKELRMDEKDHDFVRTEVMKVVWLLVLTLGVVAFILGFSVVEFRERLDALESKVNPPSIQETTP